MKKVVCIILISALIILPALITACSNDSDIDDETTSSPQSAEQGTEPETSALNVPEKTALPEKDFEGDTYCIFLNWHSGYFNDGFDAEEITGEPVNDVIFNRNASLEKKYNVDITEEVNTDISAFSKAVLASDDSYDTCLVFGVSSLVQNDLLLDYKNVPYANLTKPWWDSYINKVYTIANKQLIVSSDMDVTTIHHARVLYFNKQLLADLQLESPYTLVNDGSWTLDAFHDMYKNASKDLNGDGVMNSDDQWGYAVQTGITINMYYALGLDFVSKDSDDLPYLSVGDEKSVSALQKLATLFADKNAVMFDSDYADINPVINEVIQKVFSENRALFFAEIVQLSERMRAAEIDFGIIPQPKYNEDQDRYYCLVQCASLGVPKNNTTLDMTGILMEEIAYYNYINLRPVIYETCLKGKYTRDEESKEMLDIVYSNRVVSLEDIFRWGIQDAMQDQMNKGNQDFVSAIEAVRKSVTDKINGTISVFTGK